MLQVYTNNTYKFLLFDLGKSRLLWLSVCHAYIAKLNDDDYDNDYDDDDVDYDDDNDDDDHHHHHHHHHHVHHRHLYRGHHNQE